jgi:hypothetical protein
MDGQLRYPVVLPCRPVAGYELRLVADVVAGPVQWSQFRDAYVFYGFGGAEEQEYEKERTSGVIGFLDGSGTISRARQGPPWRGAQDDIEGRA